MKKIYTSIIDKFHRENIYFIYTYFFIVMSVLVFWPFISTGTSFIWKPDASYNFKTMIYVSNYFKEFFKNLFINNKLILHQYDFTLWEGYDIIHAMHWPAFGNPLYFLSFLFSEDKLYIYYNIVVIVQLYISGIGFTKLLTYKGYNNNYAVLAGTFISMFSYFTLFNSARHICFLTPVMAMPFIILGLEYIFDNKKPYLYIISVFYVAISNIFFFYHVVLIVILFVLVRLISIYKNDIASLLTMIIKIGFYSIISVLMSSFIFLPIFKIMLSDSRLGVETYYSVFYPINYYKNIFAYAFSYGNQFWTCLGFSSPVLISIVFLIKKIKHNRTVALLFMFSIVLISFPIFGKIFNGMAYVTNRWSWVLSLLIGYIVTITFDDIIIYGKNNVPLLFLSILTYVVIYIYLGFNRSDVFLQISILLIALLIVSIVNNYLSRQFLLFICFLLSIVVLSTYLYSDRYHGYVSECYKIKDINEYMFNDVGKDLLDYKTKIGDDDYSRFVSGYRKDKMNNYMSKSSSIEHYYPISNSIISNMHNNLAISHNSNFSFYEYNNRTILNSLSSVKYLITKKGSKLPYGYSLEKEFEEYNLYKNDYALPVLYAYDTVVDDLSSKKLNFPTRQEISMKSAIVDNYRGIIKKKNYDNLVNEIPYKIEILTKEIDLLDNYLVTYDKDQKIKLLFDGFDNSETYCLLENFYFNSFTKYDLYKNKEYKIAKSIYNIDPYNKYSLKEYSSLSHSKKKDLKKKKNKAGWGVTNATLCFNLDNGESVTSNFKNDRDMRYPGYKDYLINLGYSAKKINSIEITFPTMGIYTFDKIGIYCDAFKEYINDIENLKLGHITNIKVGKDMITADVNTDSDKYLCAAIPYFDGWKAYVDGVETPVYLTNYYHMGIDVPKFNSI